ADTTDAQPTQRAGMQRSGTWSHSRVLRLKLSPILYVVGFTAAREVGDPPAETQQTMMPPDPAIETAKGPAPEPLNAHYDTRLPPLRWSRRVQIPFIAAAGRRLSRSLRPTLRYEVL